MTELVYESLNHLLQNAGCCRRILQQQGLSRGSTAADALALRWAFAEEAWAAFAGAAPWDLLACGERAKWMHGRWKRRRRRAGIGKLGASDFFGPLRGHRLHLSSDEPLLLPVWRGLGDPRLRFSSSHLETRPGNKVQS